MVLVIAIWGCINPVKANLGDNPYQLYLPLVSHDPYVDPWIGPWGGYVVCMAANPNNPDEIYAGTWGNGVYKSVDGGLYWTSINRGLGNGHINSLAIDPQNPKIMYAGTYHDEIYKTTSGGEVWYQSSQGVADGAIIYTIAIDPYNPDIIYIGTREKKYASPPWHGAVYRSQNEGINWTPVLTNVGGSTVQDWAYDLLVNPKDHRMVFAAFHEHGVYRSLDYGAHWEAINGNGLTDLSGRSLLINPANTSKNALYLGTWHRTGTFKSTNQGSSWVNHFLDAKVYTMDLDPVQPTNLYMADYYGGVFKSTNAGESWQYSGLQGNTMYTVMVNPKRHNQIFAGTQGNGIYRSDNYGVSWVPSQAGLINTDVAGFVVVPGEKDHYLALTIEGGFYASQDGGQTWQEAADPLEGSGFTDFSVNPHDPQQVFALSAEQGLWTCRLPDCEWQHVSTGLPESQASEKDAPGLVPRNELETELMLLEGRLVNDQPPSGDLSGFNQLALSESNPMVVYLTTAGDGVYRSANGMTHWLPLGLAGKNISSLAVDPLNEAVLVAVDAARTSIFISTDGGTHWAESDGPGGVIVDLVTTTARPGVMYAATDRGVYQRSPAGVWFELGLTDETVTVLAAHPIGELLVAACAGGVYYSHDGGATWIAAPDDLASATIRSIHFDEADASVAFLATVGQGVYRLRTR